MESSGDVNDLSCDLSLGTSEGVSAGNCSFLARSVSADYSNPMPGQKSGDLCEVCRMRDLNSFLFHPLALLFFAPLKLNLPLPHTLPRLVLSCDGR